MSWSPHDGINEAEYLWLQTEVIRCLEAKQYGNALALAPYLLLSHEPGTKGVRRDLARFLSLVVTQPWGSLEGVADALKTWADRAGRNSRLQADFVRERLMQRKEMLDHLPTLDAWSDSIFRALFSLGWAEQVNRSLMIVQIDENQIPFQGVGSKSYAQAQEFREKARTPAGKGVVPLKPGRHFATLVGHEFTVMTATAYPSGVTQVLAARFRDPIRFTKGATIRDLLQTLRRVRPYPHWIMLDRGYCSYGPLAELIRFCTDAANIEGATPTHFLMPAVKTKSHMREKGVPEEEQNALLGVDQTIIEQWNKKPTRVGDTALYFATVPRAIRDHPGLSCNLVIFYRIRKSAWRKKFKELDLERDVVAMPYFTDLTVTIDNAAEVEGLYSMRWNCENLYQKLVHVMGIIPSKDLWQRIISFLLGLMEIGVYGVHRIRSYGDLGEERRDELPRLLSFYQVARRDLENALDPDGLVAYA